MRFKIMAAKVDDIGYREPVSFYEEMTALHMGIIYEEQITNS